MRSAVVIVGAGQGAFQCAVSLREEGWDGVIRIIGDEPHLPYSRPMLSKEFLRGEAEAGELPLRPESYFQRHGIELLTARVTGIDRAARRVELETGEVLEYERLVLATGSTSRRLPIDGVELDGVLSLRGWDDAVELREQIEAAASIVVIGGGFIGTEVASTVPPGRAVTILERDPRILRRVLSEPVAGHAHACLAERDVDLRTDVGIVALRGEAGRVRAVRLEDGAELAADLVLLAAGAAPRTELAEASGLEVAAGIMVDATLTTADLRVSAIGDCARFPTPYATAAVRLESVQNAVDQGRHVAAQIVHASGAPYRAVPWFWTHQADEKIQIVGIAEDADAAIPVPGGSEHSFSILRVRGDRVTAVESVNAPRDHIRARKALAADSLSIEDFELAGPART
ncbi:NAD(P)/FAD-dependent oxidoreductase [Microbacterium sp.]|uniref:NAD(P)/FAD-dependent oxidoreductase n=1 Tax=Microbacterium sp. TaxID=51671 RepID=UPI003A92A669